MVFDLLDQFTDIADGDPITPTTANQDLVVLDIPESRGYKYILFNATVELAMVTSPVVQQLDLEILNDAAVVKTYNLSPGAVDVLGIHTYTISVPIAKNNGGTITLRLGNAAAADVDSSIMVKSVWAAGVA